VPGAGAPQSLLQWHLSSRGEEPCSETSSGESARLAINNQTRMLEKDMQLCGVVQKEWDPLGRWEGSYVYLDVSLEMKVKFALHVQRTEVMYKEHVEMFGDKGVVQSLTDFAEAWGDEFGFGRQAGYGNVAGCRLIGVVGVEGYLGLDGVFVKQGHAQKSRNATGLGFRV
jgi:hypothetical protein